jgi:hypothetical protein
MTMSAEQQESQRKYRQKHCVRLASARKIKRANRTPEEVAADASAKRAYRAENLEARRRAEREFAAAKRAKESPQERATRLAAARAWAANNKAHVLTQKRESYKKADKAAIAARKSACNKANPSKARAHRATRKAAARLRTPKWDTELTELVSLEAHDLARLRAIHTGIDWHVDHVIPLRGRKVSGLHVWNNLAVIPAVENMRKHNLYEPE